MRQLKEVIYKTNIRETTGSTDIPVTAVVSDSRKIIPGCLFVAVRGLSSDGHQFIEQAIGSGARAILCEAMPASVLPEISYIRVASTAKALGVAASNFYNNPSAELKLIGITGTNGKTTVAGLLFQVFSKMGHHCGLISTISNHIGSKTIEARYTTPDPIELHAMLHEMVNEGCSYVFMEVSSHAQSQFRTFGVTFSGGVFTNLTHDHLDYHLTFKNYLKAKQSFFDMLGKEAFALTNLDDKNGMIMVQNTKATKATYSLRAMAEFKGKVLENSFAGLHMQIARQDIWSQLVGKFNAYNIMAVYGAGRLLGISRDAMLAGISLCQPAEGRFDYFVNKEKITGIVDYAHTPDAIENVLKTIQEIRTGQERVITVIGCGGNRDQTKRAPMATISATYSDKVIFTSDNPRDEDPEAIIRDMTQGLDVDPVLKKKHLSVTYRREAIHVACIMATPGDIILVAGKGHEKYQEIKGVKHPFDDKELLKQFLNR